MSMITCPECGKEISSSAESCPNCGYVLVKSELPKIRKSKLSEKATNPVLGAICIAGGIFTIILGIITIAFVIGFFVLIAGILILSYGISKLVGLQKGNCPYCNNAITVKATVATFKCPHCKKTSTKNGDFLETID